MVTTFTSEKFSANNKITMFDHDPANSTVATDVGWVDMRDYDGISMTVFATVFGGNGITVFQIVASSSSSGAGTDGTVVSHAVGDAPDAQGDWLYLECTAEQIRAQETDSTGELRYVSAKLTAENTADEAVVTYLQWGAKHPQTGLTADVVA